jgi:hypothetical protein
MVAQGIAFAYPTQSHYAVADRLYEAEKTARTNGLGLWTDVQWSVMTADQAKKAPMDKFAIVEGEIERVASRNNVIYLNFDRNWRDDFTISVDSQRRRDFSRDGLSLMQMGGQAVRVRGWIRDYNGPFIEVFHSSQIELLDELSVNDETPASDIPNVDKDTIQDRVQPISPMFLNPTLEDLTPEGENKL